MEIIKNLPDPPKARLGRPPIYPFMKLDVGDSFLWDTDKAASITSLISRYNRITDRKFVGGYVDGQVHVKRIR